MDPVYLRLILILARHISARISCTPPNLTPGADERAKYEAGGSQPIGERGFTIVHAVTSFKYCVYIINSLELLALLSTIPNNPSLLGPYTPTLMHINPSHAVTVGTLLMVIGTMIRALSFRWLGRQFTFELAIKKDHRLVTDGPYAIVRHPSYLGGNILMLGILASLLGPGSVSVDLDLCSNFVGKAVWWWCFLSILYAYVVGIFRTKGEDKVLKETFGEEWVAWSKKTPWRLIPYVY